MAAPEQHNGGGKSVDDDSDEDDVDYQPPPPPEPTPSKPPSTLQRSSKTERPLLCDDDNENDEEDEQTAVEGSTISNVSEPSASPPPSKRPRVDTDRPTSPSELAKINELWVEMTAGLAAPKPEPIDNSYLTTWLEFTAEQTGRPLPQNLPLLADLEARQKREEKQILRQKQKHGRNLLTPSSKPNKPAKQLGLLDAIPSAPSTRPGEGSKSLQTSNSSAPLVVPKVKGMTGLEIALSLVRGQDPDTLLDRTKRAWNEFKSVAPEIRDELEDHKKDKGRYTSKVAFLERSDIREWEYEQKGRKPSRHH